MTFSRVGHSRGVCVDLECVTNFCGWTTWALTAYSLEYGPRLQIRGAPCVSIAKTVKRASAHQLQMSHILGQIANPWKITAQKTADTNIAGRLIRSCKHSVIFWNWCAIYNQCIHFIMNFLCFFIEKKDINSFQQLQYQYTVFAL